MYQLWHLLYSYESDKSRTGNEALLKKLETIFGFPREYASVLAEVAFEDSYGNLSVKAIRKILPHLQAGLDYSQACEKPDINIRVGRLQRRVRSKGILKKS